MIGKTVGAVSVLYFIYTAYIAISISGLYGILSLIYPIPLAMAYLIAGILLLMDEHKIIAALCGVAILAIPFYLSGYNVSLIIGNLMSPIYLIFSIILPVLMIYSAVKE